MFRWALSLSENIVWVVLAGHSTPTPVLSAGIQKGTGRVFVHMHITTVTTLPHQLHNSRVWLVFCQPIRQSFCCVTWCFSGKILPLAGLQRWLLTLIWLWPWMLEAEAKTPSPMLQETIFICSVFRKKNNDLFQTNYPSRHSQSFSSKNHQG